MLHHRIQIGDGLLIRIQLLRRNRAQCLTLISLANEIHQVDVVHLVAVLGALLDRLGLLVRRLRYASGALLGILLTLAILDSGRLLLLGRMGNSVHIVRLVAWYPLDFLLAFGAPAIVPLGLSEDEVAGAIFGFLTLSL